MRHLPGFCVEKQTLCSGNDKHGAKGGAVYFFFCVVIFSAESFMGWPFNLLVNM